MGQGQEDTSEHCYQRWAEWLKGHLWLASVRQDKRSVLIGLLSNFPHHLHSKAGWCGLTLLSSSDSREASGIWRMWVCLGLAMGPGLGTIWRRFFTPSPVMVSQCLDATGAVSEGGVGCVGL